WTLPPSNHGLYHTTLDVRQSPWVLTHVYQKWRTVSISNPSLWSTIAISYLPCDKGCCGPLPSASVAMAEQHVARAQNLRVHFAGSEIQDSQSLQVQILRCLIQYAARWNELFVHLTVR
ncbi:hypothetical protein R3P38DRAFT_2587551, partial [Favolaschia claudopus]